MVHVIAKNNDNNMSVYHVGSLDNSLTKQLAVSQVADWSTRWPVKSPIYLNRNLQCIIAINVICGKLYY